jgi:uncharacterized protein (DUF1697 family)
MQYVALLRGINVGGNNILDMRALKSVFEAAGMESVRTYINSGNVIFSSEVDDPGPLARTIQDAIAGHFGFEVPVLLRDHDQLAAMVSAMPAHWVNDQTMKCDVMFLWDEVDSPTVLEQLNFNDELEDVRYESGAVIWCIDRDYVTKSGMIKLIGSPLYKKMTIRNCNTARKLLALMEECT